MKFIGKSCQFNDRVKELITIDCTVLSNIEEDNLHNLTDEIKDVIILNPINSESDYVKYTSDGYLRLIDSAFGQDMRTFTCIYIMLPQFVEAEQIAEIINTMDTKNLIDNMFVYPKIDNYKLRDNEVSNLPWQRKLNSKS